MDRERDLDAAAEQLRGAEASAVESSNALATVTGERDDLARDVERLAALARQERLRRRAPSFEALLAAYAAQHSAAVKAGDRSLSPMAQVPYKLRNYSLAQSHGVRSPKIHGVWTSRKDVTLRDISVDRVVLKGDGGHSAQGVFPLERTARGWRSTDGSIDFAGDEVPEAMRTALGKARAPFFAEEFLESPSGWAIPEDVKLYCAYGQVMQVYIMRSSSDGSMERQRFSSRFLDSRGEPLGEIRNGLAYDESIDVPANFPQLVEAAQHLSLASGLPFVRVDMYATAAGPVLGELTSVPSGGKQSYVESHDKAMGLSWVHGAARLERHLMEGRPVGTLFGDQEYSWWYPAAKDPSNMHNPSNWLRNHTRCQDWCQSAS
ncbi:hypothetical protein LTI14_04545 [Nesterenkonia sp. YGD6]|uniref:ATP-grasp fold amidoligase family protein n=1 Tax=Nesterenkonia sp. YGD6 TaxID=2901231 RepID=UPI001F4C7164|nr:ATP-grasp fold amidoligase family protein [Nesterenkonia sp. YGD6]MCH8562492.1 hypothetical protein [Nesterenkonia sp. YGD6]